jgi:hypothetical protein
MRSAVLVSLVVMASSLSYARSVSLVPEERCTECEPALRALIVRANDLEHVAEARAHADGPAARRETDALRCEVARLRNRALELAVVVYHIDLSGLRRLHGRLAYVPSDATGREGGADDQHDIRITAAAFRSAAWLGSTLAHEAEVHVNRHIALGLVHVGEDEAAREEIEAYDYELANAGRFGLTEDELRDIRGRRRSFAARAVTRP